MSIVPASFIWSSDYRHVALSISGSTHTLYLDGSVVAVNPSGGNIISTIQNVFIGCAGDLLYGFTGIIDDFKIWNRALPALDITAIYNANIPPRTITPLDKISTAANTSMLYSGTGACRSAGAYGIALLSSAYTGPSIQIKNGSSGTPTDFYPALDGTPTLTTLYGGAGTSLTTFLSGAIAYVTKWYDQTGNTNHATAVGTPIYDTLNNRISFANGYFSIANATTPGGVNPFPIGNTAYSYVFTISNFNLTTTAEQFIYSGGTNTANGFCAGIIRNDPDYSYYNFWFNNSKATTAPPLMVSGTKIADCYPGGGASGNRIIYLNNIIRPAALLQNLSSRTQGFGNCYLGLYVYNTTNKYNGTLNYFYWAPYLLDISDITILGNT